MSCYCRPRDSDISDHEEDFYYEEIDESEMDKMTATMEGIYLSWKMFKIFVRFLRTWTQPCPA